MKLASRTFRREDYKLTSKFGYRKIINTSKGTTKLFHSGADYGTNGEKWVQYALEDGRVTKVFSDSYGAKCVYVEYPRIGKVLFYAHLDSIKVKVGQAVNKDTIIGYTGKTGKATGIHLHLGLKDIDGLIWIDPESYDYIEGEVKVSSNSDFLGKRGYIKLGDRGDNVDKLTKFMRKTFSLYSPASVLGNYYGPNIEKSIKEFQRRTGLSQDGCVGTITLKKLVSYGFRY